MNDFSAFLPVGETLQKLLVGASLNPVNPPRALRIVKPLCVCYAFL